MKYIEESMSPVITLTEKASEKLSRILRQPSTKQQKRTFEESKGVYAYYEKQWQEKA